MAEGYSLGQPYSSGRSFQSPVRGVRPSAGAGFSLLIDGAYIWRLVSAVFTLTTSATVANRYVTLEYQGDDGTAYCVNAAGVVVTASSTQRFAFGLGRGNSEWATGTDILAPLSPVFLHGSDTLAIVVGNIDTTDQLSGIRFVFDRFPTDPEHDPGESD